MKALSLFFACSALLFLSACSGGGGGGGSAPEAELKKSPATIKEEAAKMEAPELQTKIDEYKKVIASKEKEGNDLIKQATEKAAEALTGAKGSLKEEIDKLKVQGNDLLDQVKQLQERLQVYVDQLKTTEKK